tara:strand:+ start:2509 stop:2745 length:237 start_codon:yes stop_codon:yes gene_type:complete
MGLPTIPYDPWFDNSIFNPLDLMPIARDEPIDTMPCEYQPPGVDEEENITIHEEMYRLARAKYNPFAVGGSESIGEMK